MIDTVRDIWVFGYGSLIWKPDFIHQEKRRARLYGYHRNLCVYSVEHRGTVARPGLVFGLDRGGMCDGVAYRIAAMDVPGVIAALRAREQVTGVYRERMRPVTLFDRKRSQFENSVMAICYVVDPVHRQYVGGLSYRAQADLVMPAIGKSGTNDDYVCNTHCALSEIDIRDRHLDRLIALIGGARLNKTTPAQRFLAQRMRRVITGQGRRGVPGWSVRSRGELAINHRKNLGY